MAFEAFPTDAVDAFSDPGFCYVRENGKLRSPPGLGPSACRDLSPEELAGLPQLSPFVVGASYAVGVTCFNPRSLFSQVINFVARNLWRVESLLGFPDIVGKQLFDAAREQGVFTNNKLRHTSLKLFVEAYGSEVLSHLNVHGNHLVLEEHLEEVLLFSHLSVLDLKGCRLGEEHQVWPHIGSMSCLQRLGLCDTSLSDQVMQKLTTPLRLLKKGPQDLQILDLSENSRLTERAIRFLRVFRNLQALDVSGCCFSPHGIKQLHLEMSLRQLEGSEVDDPEVDVFCKIVKSAGWAAGVVEDWIEDARTKLRDKRVGQAHHGCPRARKFYSIKSNQLGFLDVSDKFPSNASRSATQVKIRLVKESKKDHQEAKSRACNVESPDCALVMHREGKQQWCTQSVEMPGDLFPSKCTKRIRGAESELQGINGKDQTLQGGFRCGSNSMVTETSHKRNRKEDKSSQRSEEWSRLSRVQSDSSRSAGTTKVMMKRKRKRQRAHSDDNGTKERQISSVDVIGKEEDDLMSSYLRVKPENRDSTDKSNRPRLLTAMDSANW